jgi:3-methyladenine DNA glycosylase AlkC
LLAKLKTDPSKYVRDSLANWLNDAGKTAPEQVVKLCCSWAKEPKDTNLTYVLKRALRNLGGLERLD